MPLFRGSRLRRGLESEEKKNLPAEDAFCRRCPVQGRKKGIKCLKKRGKLVASREIIFLATKDLALVIVDWKSKRIWKTTLGGGTKGVKERPPALRHPIGVWAFLEVRSREGGGRRKRRSGFQSGPCFSREGRRELIGLNGREETWRVIYTGGNTLTRYSKPGIKNSRSKSKKASLGRTRQFLGFRVEARSTLALKEGKFFRSRKT